MTDELNNEEIDIEEDTGETYNLEMIGAFGVSVQKDRDNTDGIAELENETDRIAENETGIIAENTNETDPAAEEDIEKTSSEENELSEFADEGKEKVRYDNKMAFTQLLYDFLSPAVSAFVILFLFMTLFVRQATVDGSSMQNTLQDSDRLLVNVLNYTPESGDIVIISHGESLEKTLVKRVIATGGQRISIDYSTGEVVVDGVLLHEDYIMGKTIKNPSPTDIPDVIPEGYVFVMGDNRENSKDSRSSSVGLIPVNNIVGKAFFRVWPLNSFGSI